MSEGIVQVLATLQRTGIVLARLKATVCLALEVKIPPGSIAHVWRGHEREVGACLSIVPHHQTEVLKSAGIDSLAEWPDEDEPGELAGVFPQENLNGARHWNVLNGTDSEWLSPVGSLESLADCLSHCSVTALLGMKGSESDARNVLLGGSKLIEEGLVGVYLLRVFGKGTRLAPVLELL